MRIRKFEGNNLVSLKGSLERRPSEARERRGRETVSAPEDREVNVWWTFGERQRGEAPMEVTPKGLS